MLPETLSLVDVTYIIIFMLLIGGLVGVVVERFTARSRRRDWQNRNYWKSKHRRQDTTDREDIWLTKLPDLEAASAVEQLRIVMGATFTVQPLLNRSEARVFKELDTMVLSRNPRWQVMAQVSVGEIVRCQDRTAYSCINSKRVDLLLVDEGCHPRHALEYQGSAHHQGTAAARDAVKKEALRRAGIGYHEVVAGHTTPADLRRLVEKLVDLPTES